MKIQKKICILIILLVIAILLFSILFFVVFKKVFLKNNCVKDYLNFENNNKESIFSIDKIKYFSNCNADITTNHNSSFTISNLYQYTDIAIFINNHSNGNYNASNTLKSVELFDITFTTPPTQGIPNLYYKSINDFATSNFDTNNIIENSILFETTSQDEIDYSKPILYNNCANPITLCYVNSNIKDTYTLEENISNISHNGILLKECNVTLGSIESQISLKIKITNSNNETYICPIKLNIPLSTASSSIFDGSITFEDSTNYIFIRE